MDLKQFECFINLAETLNFSQTAQIMYLTQPTVSNQIKQLEKELGFDLFIRNSRTVELSPSGKSFYEDIKDILVKVNKSIEKAKNYADKYLDFYCIAYEDNYLSINYLPKIIKKFKNKYTNILLDLKITNFKKKNMLFSDNKIDFLFTVKDNIVNMQHANYLELYKSKLVCIISNELDISCKPKFSISDLKHQTLILLNPVHCPNEMVEIEKIIIENCPTSPVVYADSTLSGCTMAKSGLGIAIMPDFIYINDDDLSIIPLDIEYYISYGIVWDKRDIRKESLDFINFAKEVYDKHGTRT